MSVASHVRVNVPAWHKGGCWLSEKETVGLPQKSIAPKLGGGGTKRTEAYVAVDGVPAVMILGLVVSTKKTKKEKVAECPWSSATFQNTCAVSPKFHGALSGKPEATGSNCERVMVAPMVDVTTGVPILPANTFVHEVVSTGICVGPG